jgi:hypothetical protein
MYTCVYVYSVGVGCLPFDGASLQHLLLRRVDRLRRNMKEVIGEDDDEYYHKDKLQKGDMHMYEYYCFWYIYSKPYEHVTTNQKMS